MTFRIEKPNVESFLKPATTLVDECKLHLSPDGVRITAVDPANVGMVDTELDADAFHQLDVGDDLTIGVDLERVMEAVDMFDDDSTIKCTYDTDSHKLHFEDDGMHMNIGTLTPDTVRDEPDIPDIDWNVTAVTEWRHVQRYLKAAHIVSDHVTMRTDDDESTLLVEANGDIDAIEGDLADHLEDGSTFDGPANSVISMDYLNDIKKGIPAETIATLRVGEAYPINITYEHLNGLGSVEFMVAPRVTD